MSVNQYTPGRGTTNMTEICINFVGETMEMNLGDIALIIVLAIVCTIFGYAIGYMMGARRT